MRHITYRSRLIGGALATKSNVAKLEDELNKLQLGKMPTPEEAKAESPEKKLSPEQLRKKFAI